MVWGAFPLIVSPGLLIHFPKGGIKGWAPLEWINKLFKKDKGSERESILWESMGNQGVSIRFNIKIDTMKILNSITVLTMFFMVIGSNAQSSEDKRIIEDAERAKKELIKKDKGLDRFFKNSSGYVIFPNVGEGGFILGGASGNGVVYENGKKIGMADLKKVDVGCQGGGQALVEVIFFETDEALERFKGGEYTITGDLSAVVVESGASENANYSDGVMVFTMPKAGLMADASVGGQRFKY